MRKQKLITSLNIAINALKNDTIYYNWTNQESCNCGIVSQAVLGKSANEIWQEFENIEEAMMAHCITEQNLISATWKNAVKLFCPLTGKSKFQIFEDLKEGGLEPHDIVHLEYLTNPAILKRSGIKTHKKVFWFFKKPLDYYKSSENLILYLQAWVSILEEGSTITKTELNTANKTVLEAELLIAVASQDYEYAAQLRNKLNK